jgi:hypothetical protein
MKNTYKMISSICLILVIVYIGSSQWIIATNVKSKWFSLFRPPSINGTFFGAKSFGGIFRLGAIFLVKEANHKIL